MKSAVNHLLGFAFASAALLRWIWRDQTVSTDPNDHVERSLRAPTSGKP